MAITKETSVSKIEVVGGWNIQVRTDIIIKEDGTEISRTFTRKVISPFISSYLTKIENNVSVPDLDTDGKKQWTHTATDISGEATEVQAVANAVWTDTVKANYKTFVENQEA